MPHHGHYIGDDEYIVAGSATADYHIFNRTANDYTTLQANFPENTNLPSNGCSLWDSKRGRLIIFGYDSADIFVLNPFMGGGKIEVTPTSKPAGLNISNAQVGGVYDSYIDKYVFWDGGEALYLLDPVTWAFSEPTLDTQTVTPTNPTTNGTYNRFQYIKPCDEYPEGGI